MKTNSRKWKMCLRILANKRLDINTERISLNHVGSLVKSQALWAIFLDKEIISRVQNKEA
jgi:hypothetical protein